MVQTLTDEGVTVQTSQQLLNGLYGSQLKWDFLLLDLNGLNSYLRSILPLIRRKYPVLPVIGIWTKSNLETNRWGSDYGLALDAYLSEVPRPEDLIVNFPDVAARYLNMEAELV
ncbi:MAG: hypothetical protein JXM69_19885 [Anaerolineae bacterium]|nr:hypothetical protein [Anaerolineae bacterium]